MIRIVAVGKKHESWVLEGIERYQKRLKKPYDVQWVLCRIARRTVIARAWMSLSAYFRGWMIVIMLFYLMSTESNLTPLHYRGCLVIH